MKKISGMITQLKMIINTVHVLEKSGELLSDIHIMLVDKLLKNKTLENMDIQNLEVVGILISKLSGIAPRGIKSKLSNFPL